MTLNDILTAALAQLDRGHDAQTLENYRVRLTQYANDAQRELADALGLFRTDKVRTSAGIVDTSLLPRRVKRIERVVQLGRAVPFRCGDRTNTLLLRMTRQPRSLIGTSPNAERQFRPKRP